MTRESVDSENKVSGNQANILAHTRRELNIDHGDTLCWQLKDDGTLLVRVVQQRSGTFSEFDSYGGDEDSDVPTDHDAWSVDVS